MRAAMAWMVAGAVVLGACGSSGDDDGQAGEAPTIAISDVTIGDGGDALLSYAFSDDGVVRVEIDWGDGSPLQGFTGESGSFSSRHAYDSAVTSVVITVVTIDADGNSSAATRTVDLVGADTTDATTPTTVPATTVVVSTAPAATAPASSTTTTTTTTTAPPPPPPPPDPTTTTTSTTTTTTAPPRNYVVTVQGDVVRVLGDCEGLTGGRGDFVITGAFDTDRSGPDSFRIGRTDDPDQIGEGETRSIAGAISQTGPVRDGELVEWEATFTATEYDVGFSGRTPDSSMNARSRSTDGVISTARSPFTQTLSVGAGNCRVDMTFAVTSEFVD